MHIVWGQIILNLQALPSRELLTIPNCVGEGYAKATEVELGYIYREGERD